MKILYHSAAPWIPTGYGRCTQEIVPRLQREGHDVAIQCLSSVSKRPIMWHGDESDVELEEPIKVYPSDTQFGLGQVEKHFKKSGADFYFTHFDTWMKPARELIPKMNVPYSSYVIVDHDPAPENVINQVNNAISPVAMSDYAKMKLREKGIGSVSIPHGVDTEDFRPLENDSEASPSRLEVQTDSGDIRDVDLDDVFLFGMVAANHGDRKHIPGHMEAFNTFLEEVDDSALLYVHTNPTRETGHDLIQVKEEIGIPDENIIWTRADDYNEVGDQYLNSLYNAFDVLMNCSYGESWGLTITEAQSAGTPCIVSNFSSMPEQLGVDVREELLREETSLDMAVGNPNVLQAPHGIVVEPTTGIFRERLAAKQYICDPDDIFDAMRYYYNNPGVVSSHGSKAREFVEERYGWDNVVGGQWKSYFDSVEDML